MLLCDCVWLLLRCGGVGTGRFGLVDVLRVQVDVLRNRDDAPICAVYCWILFLIRPGCELRRRRHPVCSLGGVYSSCCVYVASNTLVKGQLPHVVLNLTPGLYIPARK